MATLCAKQAFERVAASVETGSQLPFAACSSSGYYAGQSRHYVSQLR